MRRCDPRQAGELSRFALVGVASTLLYLLLFLALRAGPLTPLVANAAALALSAVFNTGVNRRFTFGRRGREGLATHHFQGLVVFGFCLGLTTGALAALGALAPGASQAVEVGVLVAANAAATLLRYWLLRLWVFGPRAAAPGQPGPELQVPCLVTGARSWRRNRRGWQGRRPEGVAEPRRAVEDAAGRDEGKPGTANVARHGT